MNVLFTLVLAVPFLAGVDTTAHQPFWSAIAFLMFLQLTASLLNLMPIPGVDGGNAIEPWLNQQWRRGFALMAPYGMLLLFVLLWNPYINAVFFNIVFGIGDAFGVPDYLYGLGYNLFWPFPSLF